MVQVSAAHRAAEIQLLRKVQDLSLPTLPTICQLLDDYV
jgi:hypothetical protein